MTFLVSRLYAVNPNHDQNLPQYEHQPLDKVSLAAHREIKERKKVNHRYFYSCKK